MAWGGKQARYGGIGHYLSDRISERAEAEVRVTVLGHVQRGGDPTFADRMLATRLAAHATDLLLNGVTGQLIGITNGKLSQTPIPEVAGRTKPLPEDMIHLAEVMQT